MRFRPWCPYAVTSPSTRQQPRPPPLINFALPFKKAYRKFPISFTSAPGAHKKAYLYWSPLPEIVFQREDIILCPSSIKGSSALQRLNQYQSNTGARGHIQESVSNKNTFSMNYFGVFGRSYFCLPNLNSVTSCQATCGLPFNWVWHVSHLRLTLPVYKHGVHPSLRKLWKNIEYKLQRVTESKVTKCSHIVKW